MFFALWQLILMSFLAVLGVASLACLLLLAYDIWRGNYIEDDG